MKKYVIQFFCISALIFVASTQAETLREALMSEIVNNPELSNDELKVLVNTVFDEHKQKLIPVNRIENMSIGDRKSRDGYLSQAMILKKYLQKHCLYLRT